MKTEYKCQYCNVSYLLEIDDEGWEEWQSGELIQVALPDLKAWERELMLSGTCDNCWKEFFGEEDGE
tara:strand:+ start:1357 stop:1557 length:201 start_codon:yes stop_codon:yes gene_type:complete